MNSVVIHSAAPTYSGINPVLREGSSVYVRILGQKNGKYEAFFNGAKFLVDSPLQFQKGDSFLATVKIVNNKVNLIPVQKEQNFQNQIVENKNIFEFLKDLGLPSDNLSVVLLNQMKSFDQKFDLSLLKKIRNIAQKFTDKEKTASILMILNQKGVELSENAVQKMLDLFENENGEKNQQKNNEFLKENKVLNVEDEFKKFFKSVFENPGKNEGVLSLFNNLGFSLKKINFSSNWIHIPFEFFYLFENVKNSGSGFVNLFVKEKKVDSAVVKFNFPENDYKFVLKFKNKKCVNLIVCQKNEENSIFNEKFVEFLKKNNAFDKDFLLLFDEEIKSDFESEKFLPFEIFSEA